MDNVVRVRAATRRDATWMLAALATAEREYRARSGVRRQIRVTSGARERLCALVDQGPAFVAERTEAGDEGGAVPVGFLVGLLSPHVLDPEIATLIEVLWWVAPYARRTRAATELLDAYLAYGREYADWILLTTGPASAVGHRSLARRGFHTHETTYLCEC